MQRSLFFIKQNSIKACIIDVSRANRNRRQASAAREGEISDAGDAIRDGDVRQVATAREGAFLDASNAIRNRDTRQAAAPPEGGLPDASDAIRNRYARQAGAAIKGSDSDAGDRIALNCVGNDQLACSSLITPISGGGLGVLYMRIYAACCRSGPDKKTRD